jgi:hypothetical protein
MYDQVYDTFRKAAESTFQVQQEMFRQWMGSWPAQTPATTGTVVAPRVVTGMDDQARSFQKKWIETLTTTLNKHREILDTQYKSSIQAIEVAFRATEAKNPDEYRKLTEEFWRMSIDSLKTAFENQIREFQSLTEKWFEIVTKAKV